MTPLNPPVTEVEDVDLSDPVFLQGRLEYDCRQAIRDLKRLVGFDAMREKVAEYVNDENPRTPKWLRS